MCSLGHCWGVGEELVDFSGDIAFEAADDLSALGENVGWGCS